MSEGARAGSGNAGDGLSVILIHLFRGVVHREDNEARWNLIERYEPRIRDYVRVLGLDLVYDADAGYAFLRMQEREDEEERELPRLVARRQLSYQVSLILALLRRRLAEHDALSGEERLVLERGDIVEMVRTFLPAGSSEARVEDRIGTHLKRIAELGFIRFLDDSGERVEIKRILAAFVDAQWLGQFEQRLAEYRNWAGNGGDDG
jgi:catechol 2,3-dioxygenase-like lactoylglutathione lyase family enzyme